MLMSRECAWITANREGLIKNSRIGNAALRPVICCYEQSEQPSIDASKRGTTQTCSAWSNRRLTLGFEDVGRLAMQFIRPEHVKTG